MKEIKKIIDLDIGRTYSEYPLFKDEKTREVLTNVLLIWAHENLDTSYKQGMNEIVSLIYIVIYPFYFDLPDITKEELENKIEKCFDSNHKSLNFYNPQFSGEMVRNIFTYLNCDIEADLYYIFDNFMIQKDFKSFYFVPSKTNLTLNKENIFEEKVIYIYYYC